MKENTGYNTVWLFNECDSFFLLCVCVWVGVRTRAQLYMHMIVEVRGYSQILLVIMYCVLSFETEAGQFTNSRDMSASSPPVLAL